MDVDKNVFPKKFNLATAYAAGIAKRRVIITVPTETIVLVKIYLPNLYDLKIYFDNLDLLQLQNSMYFIMRDGIFPTWEDPKNRMGGCVSFKYDNINPSPSILIKNDNSYNNTSLIVISISGTLFIISLIIFIIKKKI